MKVRIPTPLQSYTGSPEVEAEGESIGELLLDLDRQYPGIRFRMIDEQGAIRTHIKIFINRQRVVTVDEFLEYSDEVQILQALSGG